MGHLRVGVECLGVLDPPVKPVSVDFGGHAHQIRAQAGGAADGAARRTDGTVADRALRLAKDSLALDHQGIDFIELIVPKILKRFFRPVGPLDGLQRHFFASQRHQEVGNVLHLVIGEEEIGHHRVGQVVLRLFDPLDQPLVVDLAADQGQAWSHLPRILISLGDVTIVAGVAVEQLLAVGQQFRARQMLQVLMALQTGSLYELFAQHRCFPVLHVPMGLVR